MQPCPSSHVPHLCSHVPLAMSLKYAAMSLTYAAMSLTYAAMSLQPFPPYLCRRKPPPPHGENHSIHLNSCFARAYRHSPLLGIGQITITHPIPSKGECLYGAPGSARVRGSCGGGMVSVVCGRSRSAALCRSTAMCSRAWIMAAVVVPSALSSDGRSQSWRLTVIEEPICHGLQVLSNGPSRH